MKKENDNPVIYHVAEDHPHAILRSSPNQVASEYLEPFSSQDPSSASKRNYSYSWQLISSYHNAIHDIVELDRNHHCSTTRNPCSLLTSHPPGGSDSSNEQVSTNTNTSSRNHRSKRWEPTLVFSSRTLPSHGHVETSSTVSITKRDPISCIEVFNIIRNIQDPEHPLTLEQLNVVNIDSVRITENDLVLDPHSDPLDLYTKDSNTPSKPCSSSDHSVVPTIHIQFTPTIPHCSMATLIGLCIKVKLMRSLKQNYWNIDVRIKPGTHVSEVAINRQLNDKERVKASLENDHLLNVVNKCIKGIVPS